MTNPQPILELTDVHTYYGNIHALKGISCAIQQGEIACLIGANGAGKSTTLMTIFCVERASRGEIRFKGDPIQHLRPEQVAARGVSQAPEIFRELEAYRMLAFGGIMTTMMILKPEGLIPASRRRRELHEADEKKHTE